MHTNFISWIRKYGATLFVVAGLAAVVITTNQVQNQQSLLTRADSGEQEPALGIWWDPTPVVVAADGTAWVRLKLESLDQTMTKARLVFDYDPTQMEIEEVAHGVVFDSLAPTQTSGRLVLLSEGEFLGTGTWVKLKVRLLSNQEAKLSVDSQLSSLRYDNRQSLPVRNFELQVSRYTTFIK